MNKNLSTKAMSRSLLAILLMVTAIALNGWHYVSLPAVQAYEEGCRACYSDSECGSSAKCKEDSCGSISGRTCVWWPEGE